MARKNESIDRNKNLSFHHKRNVLFLGIGKYQNHVFFFDFFHNSKFSGLALSHFEKLSRIFVNGFLIVLVACIPQGKMRKFSDYSQVCIQLFLKVRLEPDD